MSLSRTPRRTAAFCALLLGTAATLVPLPATHAQGAPTAAAKTSGSKATKIASVEGITEYALPNGLHVLLFPDQSKPTITVNITYLVGSRHEGYGEAGMAHLLEHLSFKGTPKHKDIPQELTQHGSRPNGTTWYDRTNYFETVPASEANLDWALDLEADRMVNSFIAKKDLESEFSVVRNEFEAGENSPGRVTLERMMSTAYLWHGYGRSTIGSKSDIERVPIERLQAFYHRFYQPDNAVLVVAGKIDPSKTLNLVEKKFAGVPRPKRSLAAGNLLLNTYTLEPTQDGEREVTIRRTGDAQLMMVGYHVPAGSHPDFAAIDVLADVLGNNPSGRLYKALVDAKLASAAYVGDFQLREPGMLFAQVQLRMNQSLDSARAAVEKTLDAAATSTFTREEVDRAKASLLKNIELTLNNSEYVGYELTEWAAMGDWRLFFVNRDRIAKVTPADVQRVAAAYLKPSNRTVAMFIPTAKPDRAEIPATPNVQAIVAEYKGHEVVQAGEAFDASVKNIESRVQRSALPNGMKITLLPKQTRGGRVVANIVLRFGTEQSLTGKSMDGSLAAAMLSRGTTQLTREQVKDSLDKLKAQVVIFGQSASAIVMVETTRENFLPTLDLVAQELRSPRFDAAEFDKLKRERLAGIEQNKSEPMFIASTLLQRKLNPVDRNHPTYVATPDEQIADITAASLDSTRAFHTRFYGASYGDVAVVGDFDAGAVKAAVARLFGDWKNPQPYVRIARRYVALDSSTEKVETPDKANAAFFAGQNLKLSDDEPDYAAMSLANFMLGGGFLNSRLAVRIRQKEGISYGVGSGFGVQTLDSLGTFNAYAIYAPQNVNRLVAAYLEEIQKVRKEGFTAQEIESAKPGFLQQRIQSRANDDELMMTLVNRRFTGRTLGYDEKFEQQVQALTPAQVNAAVQKYLDPAHMVMIKAGDFAKHPPVTAQP